ncbi:hypothetical protein [Sphaerisporangium fuscum]|uniref:hypothetical protein n=1 Tax=Sphaerisporangium fuscum TaxID=2835868 RepID=UPI001BDC8189|nr:hypothetical protein [Sphaerisporangium fuscum]
MKAIRPILAAVPLLLALGACGAPAGNDGVASAGGGTAKPAASASGPGSTDRKEAGIKFAQCMREHGVDMKDPGSDGAIRIQGGKGDQQKIADAQQACKHFMDAVVGDKAGKPDPKMQDQMLKFAQCMREHGIPMKDPAADGRVEINIPAGTPKEKVDAANEACKEFAPGGGPS